MKPTTTELAAIAANLPGTATERARAALAVWQACQRELERQAELAAPPAPSPFGDATHVSHEEFLRAAMPTTTKAPDRARHHRAWVRWLVSFHDGLEGEALEAATAEAIRRERVEGYPAALAAELLASLRAFSEREAAAARSERARKGGEAKKISGHKKTARKRPQARRKPPQA